jgi:subtilase family serine protease
MFRIRRKAVMMAALAAVAAATVAVPAVAGATTTPPTPTVRTLAPAQRTSPVGVLPLMGQEQEQQHGVPIAGYRAARAATTAPAAITSPLTPSQCVARFKVPCYDGRVLREIYGQKAWDEGKGGVVALIMPYNNPVAAHDLDVYAAQSGLPKPDLVVKDIGHPVTANPANPVQTDAMVEEELDLQMIDAMAPKAEILLVQVPVDFSLSPLDFGYYGSVLEGLVTQKPKVDAVSLSLGWAEENYAEAADSPTEGNAIIRSQAAAIDKAVRDGITFTVATGDTGSAGVDLAGTGVYTTPSVLFPASDPMVLGASGTEVSANDAGGRTTPDTVWSNGGDNGATGGGLSGVFALPAYQRPYSTASGRGVGDLSMDAATESPVWVYTSRYNAFSNEALGWQLIAGTSAAAPEETGLITDAAAYAHRPLGYIQPYLYKMALHPVANGLEPVTSGCNGDYGVAGFCATDAPWSAPDGVGTVQNGARFVVALARAASAKAA